MLCCRVSPYCYRTHATNAGKHYNDKLIVPPQLIPELFIDSHLHLQHRGQITQRPGHIRVIGS